MFQLSHGRRSEINALHAETISAARLTFGVASLQGKAIIIRGSVARLAQAKFIQEQRPYAASTKLFLPISVKISVHGES
jgi:hypothetical protein